MLLISRSQLRITHAVYTPWTAETLPTGRPWVKPCPDHAHMWWRASRSWRRLSDSTVWIRAQVVRRIATRTNEKSHRLACHGESRMSRLHQRSASSACACAAASVMLKCMSSSFKKLMRRTKGRVLAALQAAPGACAERSDALSRFAALPWQLQGAYWSLRDGWTPAGATPPVPSLET